MVHELKIEKKYFLDVVEGRKSFEVRQDDRPFAVGDFLALNEIDYTSTLGVFFEGEVVEEQSRTEHTGRCALVVISYILRDKEYVKDGFCILGIRPAKIGYTFDNMAHGRFDVQYGAVVYDREQPPEFSQTAY